MKIYNKTVLTKKELLEIVNSIQRTGNKKMIASLIMAVVVLVASILLYIFQILEVYYIYICSALVVLIIAFIFFVRYNNNKNNNFTSDSVTYEYIFMDEYFTLLANNSNIYYKSLYMVRDAKKYVFLYLDMKTILIVNKDSFQTKEDYESFNKILIDNKLLKKNKNEYEFKSM